MSEAHFESGMGSPDSRLTWHEVRHRMMIDCRPMDYSKNEIPGIYHGFNMITYYIPIDPCTAEDACAVLTSYVEFYITLPRYSGLRARFHEKDDPMACPRTTNSVQMRSCSMAEADMKLHVGTTPHMILCLRTYSSNCA